MANAKVVKFFKLYNSVSLFRKGVLISFTNSWRINVTLNQQPQDKK